MCYLSPSHETPQKAAQLELVDLKATNVIPDPQSSDDGRQEALLSSHQSLYAVGHRELWFHHIHKRTTTLGALPTTSVVIDSWKGPKRSYWLFRAFIDKVEFLALMSGFGEEEARALLERLASITGNGRLAEWHDSEHRDYMNRISS